ncbi:MAG: hypothetical protein ABL930_10015 [Pseudobdellovibrio sp.]
MTDLNVPINRYGGVQIWDRLHYIVINVKKLGGLIPRLKGIGFTFSAFGHVHIYPKEFRVIFFDRKGIELGIFEAGKIIQNNKVIAENYRLKFKSFSKYRMWNNCDAMYFFGAALTTYSSVPFILPQYKVSEEVLEDGICINAEFPPNFHTHGKYQRFYYGSDGLLKRHDYHAEIISFIARGAHYTSDFKEIKNFPIPTKRKVFARIGRLVLPIPVLNATLEPIDVVFK